MYKTKFYQHTFHYVYRQIQKHQPSHDLLSSVTCDAMNSNQYHYATVTPPLTTTFFIPVDKKFIQ